MKKIENVSTLKIHKLSQEQYDREFAAGNLEDNAFYVTPAEEIDLSPYATIAQLNGKANTSHNHNASNITSGTLVSDRLPTVPVSKGGTGSTTVAGARNALGLGNTNGALPVANGGTGSTTAAAARSALGITPANIGAAVAGHNHDDRYIRTYGLNTINIDSTSGNWTTDVSISGHGTYPLGDISAWYNITQTTSGHFMVQTAIRCIGSLDSSRKTSMWVRDRYTGIVPETTSHGVWSQWTQVV